MVARLLVVVSGLPASGKSTVGEHLSSRLSLPLLAVAADRFDARERHPGHLDRTMTNEERDQGRRRLRDTHRGPLRLGGPLVTVDTSRPVDVEALLDRVRAAIGG
jgi:hypothetical protein